VHLEPAGPGARWTCLFGWTRQVSGARVTTIRQLVDEGAWW